MIVLAKIMDLDYQDEFMCLLYNRPGKQCIWNPRVSVVFPHPVIIINVSHTNHRPIRTKPSKTQILGGKVWVHLLDKQFRSAKLSIKSEKNQERMVEELKDAY